MNLTTKNTQLNKDKIDKNINNYLEKKRLRDIENKKDCKTQNK